MFNRERFSELLDALSAKPGRTLITAVGVAWGIFILVILLALTNGLRTGVKGEFSNFASNSMFMWSQGTSKPYKGLPKGRYFNFKLEDVAVLREQVPELKYISPRNQLGGFRGANNVTRKAKTGAYNIYGDYPEFIKQQPMDITAGRFISYSDIEEKRKICIIGVDVVKGLYDLGEEPIGSYIKINGINFLVVGTFKNPKSSGDQEEEANTIFIPFTTFSQAFNRADNVGWMAITANDDVQITDVKERVFTIMREQRKVHPEDLRAIGHFDLAKEWAKQSGLFTILTIVGYFVGFLILLSGAIGVTNIMLIAVKERTKEIGIRRALGATPNEIKLQIVQEAFLITFFSGMLGVAFSALVIFIVNKVIDNVGPLPMFANPTVDVKIVLLALVVLVIFGILAGLLPAVRSTKMKPVDALRTD
jgi:putative ABC transport system permease protein